MPKIRRDLTDTEDRIIKEIFDYSFLRGYKERTEAECLFIITMCKVFAHYEKLEQGERVILDDQIDWNKSEAYLRAHFYPAQQLAENNTYRQRPEQSWGLKDYTFALMRRAVEDHFKQ